MNILNQPINPGGHPVFPAAKEAGQLMPASVRFDGAPAQPSAGRAQAHSPRWQAQTLRRASSYIGVDHGAVDAADSGSNGRAQAQAAAAPAPAPTAPFEPLTINFLRSLLDRDSTMSPIADDAGADAQAPPQLLALRVVVSSAVELDTRQTEQIARKMRRITGFVNLRLENVVDPSLIAGFVVCYGTGDSHVIDLSVRGKLAALKNRVDSFDQNAHGHPQH